MTDPAGNVAEVSDDTRRQRYKLDDSGFDEVPREYRKFYRHWAGPGDSLAPNEVLCPVCNVVVRYAVELRSGDRLFCKVCMTTLALSRNRKGVIAAEPVYR